MPIVQIGQENCITVIGEPPRHIEQGVPYTETIHIEYDGWMRAGSRRLEEVCVHDAILGFDIDLHVGYISSDRAAALLDVSLDTIIWQVSREGWLRAVHYDETPW